MTQHHPQDQSNGLGIASLILGILSITGFSILTAIPAVITGILGLKHPASKSMSVAGIIMGGFSILLALLFVLFFVIIFIIAMAAESPSAVPPIAPVGPEPVPAPLSV